MVQGIGPAFLQQRLIGGAWFRLKQGVAFERPRREDVSVRGDHVVVVRQHGWMPRRHQASGMRVEALEPVQLVGELGAGLRVAIGHVAAADNR